MALRASSTRPLSLSAFATLLKKPLVFPCFANGSSSRIMLSSSLANPVSAVGLYLGVCAYCSSFVLLSCSLRSPSDVDVQSVAERALTLGAKDSIAWVFAFVRWNVCKGYRRYAWKEGLTSQFSKMKQSPPATDLSGPKASEESLTPRRNSLAVADAVDFQSDLFLSSVPCSLLFEEGSSWTGSVIAEATRFAEEKIRGGRTGRVLFAHCRVSRHRSMGWMPADRPGRHSLKKRSREEGRGGFCSLTVGSLVIDRCGWINLDDILVFALVLLLTGSALHYVLGLQMQAGALTGSTSFGIVLSLGPLSSFATAFREPAFQAFERFRYGIAESHVGAVSM